MKEISAGGVVYRKNGNQTELLLIEDRYMKASLPKGKQESGETIEETALREIEEETGIIGKVVFPLETIYYNYYHPELGAIEKEVHYFLVEALSGTLTPQMEEINQVSWLSWDELWKKQKTAGYDNNISVLKKASDLLGLTQSGDKTS